MVRDGNGPKHGLWTCGAQTKRIDVTPTPWAIIPALGLGVVHCLHSMYDGVQYSKKCKIFQLLQFTTITHPIRHQSSHSPPPTPQHCYQCHLHMWDRPFLEHRPPASSSLPPRAPSSVGCRVTRLLPLSSPSTASASSRRDLSLVVVASRGLSPSHLPPSPPPPPLPRMP